MTWPAVKFVDAPSAGATVRLDLSTSSVGVASDGFSLGAPTLNGDPGAFGAEYQFRQITLTVIVKGTKAAALAAMANLWREVLRPDNYLLFQLQSTSTPVWFHTYRSQPGELALDTVYDESTGTVLKDFWQITVPLDADPWGIGAQETVVTNVNITMDPAGGTNPCRYVVPVAVKGDAPAPAVVNFSWEQSHHGFRHMVAVARSTGATWQVGGSDGWTAGTDTGASTSDATFSGGSYRPVTFATVATMADRITGPAPAAITNGTYRVLARVARSTTTDQFALRFGIKVVFNYQYGATVAARWNTSTGSNHAAWVDLGVFPIPLSTDQPGTNTPDIALGIQRLAGSGQARIDCIKLVPVDTDGTTLFVDHPDLGAGGGFLFSEIHDAESERMYYRDISGPISSQAAQLSGGWPYLVPGAANTNVVHVLGQTSLTVAKNFWQDAPDRIADDVTMTLTYRPRYLNLPA